MNENNTVLEKIISAVRPLTDDNLFFLETVEYGTYYGHIKIKIISEDMNIIFSEHMRYKPEISCYLEIKSENKSFNLKYLIPALKLKLSLEKDENGDIPEHYSDNIISQQQFDEIDYLLKNTGFIENLNKLCTDIKSELPVFLPRFDKEEIDETIQLYVAEFRKNKFNQDRRAF